MDIKLVIMFFISNNLVCLTLIQKIAVLDFIKSKCFLNAWLYYIEIFFLFVIDRVCFIIKMF